MLPEAGHAPHREAPETTLKAIVDFVGATLAAAT
jgi:pimeloyl-ACP methyl ester carboxylesterase